jgi:hypothetical protein
MKTTSIILITASLTITATKTQASLADSIGHYSTGVIPKSYGLCDTLKPRIESAFITSANVEIIATECHSSSRGSVVTLNFVNGSKPIEFNSTRGRTAGEDLAGRGYIKTQAECEVRRANVVEQFKTATGLQPFFDYCTEDEAANSSTHPWHVAIEATGAGAMKYQYTDRMLSDGLSTDPTTLTNEVKQYFSARPETLLVDVVYRMDALSFGRIGIAVFAKNHVSINKNEFLSTRLAPDCAFEAEELKLAAARSGMVVIGHGCQLDTRGSNSTFLITETRATLSHDRTGITFEDMSACRAARSSVLEDMRKLLGESVVGIHCSDMSDGPTAYVILKP